MKKLIYLLFLVCFPTMIMAQWVTDNKYGFKINVPSNWTQESKVVGTDKVYDFVDPTQNIFIEVRAFKADGNTTADNISQVFESQYLPTAQRVAFDNYTLNNTPGKFAGYTMHVDGLDVGIAAFYAVKNGNGYVIWSMIETKHYNQYSGQGDNIMNTFTSFASSSPRAKTIVIPSSFKITNMKLGAKLTSDYDILPQDESTNFNSDEQKIYVIWDWEGSAAGKKMDIRWYKDGKEITVARKTYTLPADKQGYGYSNIIGPASGFIEGNYYVQINFENKKQRSINFRVKKAKAASNQNSGFVIKPPSGGGGKGLNPNSNSNNNSSNNTNASSFMIDVNSVKIGSELRSGAKADLKNPRNKFYTNTPEIIVVFDWKGNGQGKNLTVNWDYYKTGAGDKTRILSDHFNFPSQNGGESNFVLTKPNNGWPLGQYWIEFYLGDQFVYEWRFDVIEGSESNTGARNSSGGNSGASNSTNSTDWGKASGGSSAATSGSGSSASSSSSGKTKTIVLTSGTNKFCYSFKSGKVHGDHETADIMVEPWCTEEAGVCGNWVATSQTSLAALTSPPASGYISDLAGYVDCQLMPSKKVIVVKLADGTFAKMIILKTEFSKIQNSDRPCQHKITIKLQYPF